MNRRTFLQFSTLASFAAIGYFLNPLKLFELQNADARKISEPEMELPDLQFAELELRTQTDSIVIHHSGTENRKDLSVSEIHKYHRNLGWAGIGYHFVIRQDGTIERGRYIDTVGAHCYEHNGNTVGICLSGNFNYDQPTKKQLNSAKKLTAWLCQKYHLDPHSDSTLLGHRDLILGTNCPGMNLYEDLDELRDFCIRKVRV